LEIIISATRTLQSHEIQGALSIGVENQTIDFDRRRSRIPLVEICGPIVEVHPNGVIDMIHPTAKRLVVYKPVDKELTLAATYYSTTVAILSTFTTRISQWLNFASPISLFLALTLLYPT
jgi:hypothetical protein